MNIRKILGLDKHKPELCLQQKEIEILLDRLYELILGRPADLEGRTGYAERILHKNLGLTQIIEALLSSTEYKQKNSFWHDPAIQAVYTPKVAEFSQNIALSQSISIEKFETLWKETFTGRTKLIIGQKEYARVHKKRFWELFNAAGMLISQKPSPCLLEFGVSEYSRFYKKLFPGLELELADRPVDENYIGFTPRVACKISGCENYHVLDLNNPDSIIKTIDRRYDLIICAEVLEHLVVNPVSLLGGLLGLLKDDGFLYLTTPNFFRTENTNLLKKHINPQAVYPAPGGNWDAHYHFREYGLKELLNHIRQANGQVKGFYFSDCWENSEPFWQRSFVQDEKRGNLVMVVKAA